MSFPRYPKYKASGVEWIGVIPEHWGVGQSRRYFLLRNERAREGDRQLTASQKHGVIFQDEFMRLESQRVVQVIKGADILKHVEPNDFVISMRSFEGGIEWCRHRGCISSAYVMLIPNSKIHGPFFAHLLKSKSYIQALQTTSNLVRDGQALRYDNFTQVDLPLIPIAEQAAIATFLDRETAKIDALVAEQQRLIELLKEKRQAVISHAVTKGLNPDAPMKPSGIEWLGEVPGHWEVRRLSPLSSKITNGYVGPTRDILTDDGVRYLQSLHIKSNRIHFDVPYFVAEDWSRQHSKSILETGDVLIVQTGDIGQSTVVTDEFAGCNCHALIVVAPIRSVVSGDWISWVLNSDYGYHSLLSIQTGALHPHLNCGDVKDLMIPLPQLREQQEIVTFIVEQVLRFDTLINEAQRAIDLLQERRTALISAAVTGQIDVRGFAEDSAA